MGYNLFSFGDLIDYLPSASPRAIIIKPTWLHRLFPQKTTFDGWFFYIKNCYVEFEEYKSILLNNGTLS